MKRYTWIIGVLLMVSLLGISSCDTELESVGDGSSEELTPLTVLVSNRAMTKGRIEGTYMPNLAEVGLFLRTMSGANYDGNAYDNVRYAADGEGLDQVWNIDPAVHLGLSKTKGVAYAYYPRQADGVSLTNIPITNDGTDWMYSETPVTNLYNKNSVAQFTMVHALTIIRCQILKGDYNGVGVAQGTGVKGPSLAKGAALDLQGGGCVDFVGLNSDIKADLTGTLDTSNPLTADLWAIPTTEVQEATLMVRVDGKDLVINTPAMQFLPGVIHQFTLTVSAGTLSITSISLTDWFEEEDQSLVSVYDPSDYSITWDVAKQTDGVYAITESGRALGYEYTNGTSYAGVALVVNGQAYQIANVDAKGDDGTYTIYWWKEDYADIEALYNYTFIDGYSKDNHAYIHKADGTYAGMPHMDNNWSNWINKGVLAAANTDFKGKENTDILVDLLGTTANTIGKAVVDFRNDSESNAGHEDWYVPSVAQLTCIGIMAAEIESVLAKVPGAMTFYRENKTDYWSSTEANETKAWYVGFWDGGVYIAEKYNNRPKRCRLIRNL